MKRINNSDAPAYISKRISFRNSTGSLYARTTSDVLDGYMTGYLPHNESERLRNAVAERPTYVVYSYNTPIAWTEGDSWHIPDVYYSATTSRHQALTRRVVNA